MSKIEHRVIRDTRRMEVVDGKEVSTVATQGGVTLT